MKKITLSILLGSSILSNGVYGSAGIEDDHQDPSSAQSTSLKRKRVENEAPTSTPSKRSKSEVTENPEGKAEGETGNLPNLGKIDNYVQVSSNQITEEGEIGESLLEEIERIEECGTSIVYPLELCIGEGIVNNQKKFDFLMTYLKNKDIKNIYISMDQTLNPDNKITEIKPIFFCDTLLESFESPLLENITKIGVNFLTGNNLTKFSTKELEKVNEIGAFFLSDNLLTSFSAESLKNVQTIGYGFLSHNNLTEFSTKGLEKVTSIGAKFLSDNTNLTHVDLRGLKNIEELGEGMFDYCGNIKEIIASKEKEEFFKKNIPDHLVKKIVVK